MQPSDLEIYRFALVPSDLPVAEVVHHLLRRMHALTDEDPNEVVVFAESHSFMVRASHKFLLVLAAQEEVVSGPETAWKLGEKHEQFYQF